MIFIFDASPIIAFYSENELSQPNLLSSLSENCNVVIPSAVFDEIKRGGKPTFALLSKAVKDGTIVVNNDVSSEETESLGRRYPRLHNGELQVLLIGMQLKKISKEAYCCVIDEAPARIVAQRNDIPLKGTKGLIIYLKEIGIIKNETMESLLYRLNHCNFRT